MRCCSIGEICKKAQTNQMRMRIGRRWLAIVLFLAMAAALLLGFSEEKAPLRVSFGSAEELAGTWLQEPGQLTLLEEIPEDRDQQVLLLRTHWQDYDIFVDDSLIFSAREERMGAVHLFALPDGKTLHIRFYAEKDAAFGAIRQSKAYLGTKSGIYRKVVKENLYAVLFGFLALTAAAAVLYVGFHMRAVHFGNSLGSMISLGLYILCAGIWVLTDSSFLLLVTTRTGVVELVSFLAFYCLPLPLLEFTKRMAPGREKVLNILQTMFEGTLLLFVINYLADIVTVTVLIVVEHLLMAVTIAYMLCFGLRELKQRRNRKLVRVMVGYAVFFLCSAGALVYFYLGNARAYSWLYVLGILGFIICLANAAWIEIYEQIQENANVELYARLAFQDRMTGLKNRSAFIEEMHQLREGHGALGCIVLDVNNLKKTNDSLGHSAGDELITRVAGCIQRSVREKGNCYRVGGDEFVVILRDMDREKTAYMADTIHTEICREDAGSTIQISASLGWSWTDQPEEDPEVLFQRADAAMYEEKRRSKASRQE